MSGRTSPGPRTSGSSAAPATCDTSVLVAALTSWHPLHRGAHRALVERVRAVPAHVLLETYSVLTRLPPPHRIAAEVAGQALSELDREVLALPGPDHAELIAVLARGDVRGGATYDAVVAATARHHGLVLLTADRRARQTYDLVGVPYELLTSGP